MDEFDPNSIIGKEFPFVAEPYHSGKLRVDTCVLRTEAHSRGSCHITGTVIEGTTTSRLFQYVSHRSCAGETMDFSRVWVSDIVEQGRIHYVYPV